MARSDMFLKIVGQRTGEIAGESVDKQFAGQIDVVDWSWGMTAPSAIGGTRTARVQMSELKLVKRADKASTALMSLLNTNEVISSAVLTVRKAGGTASLPYFVLTLSLARINAYEVVSDMTPEGVPGLKEHLSLAFKSISIEYTAQSDQGVSTGSSTFSGDAAPA